MKPPLSQDLEVFILNVDDTENHSFQKCEWDTSNQNVEMFLTNT